jgi:hypothetical protein
MTNTTKYDKTDRRRRSITDILVVMCSLLSKLTLGSTKNLTVGEVVVKVVVKGGISLDKEEYRAS